MHLRKRGGHFTAGNSNKSLKGSQRLEAERSLIAATTKRTVQSSSGGYRPGSMQGAGTRRPGAAGGIQAARGNTPAVWKPKAVGGAGAYVAGGLPVGAAAQTRVRSTPRLLVILAGALFLALVSISGALLLTQRPALALGQEVYFEGRMLCVAQSSDIANDALRQIQDDLRNTYGMDIQVSQELSFKPVSCESSYLLGVEGVKGALTGNIDVKVVASVITVNDHPAVALQTPEEARQALDAVLLPFQNAPENTNRSDYAFVENVQILEMPIDYALVLTAEDAVRTLTMGAGVEDNPYTVEKGDSLARIAKQFGFKVSDLFKANPVLIQNSVIQPGQTLNAVKPNNWVNVRYTETITREEALPFETVEQTTDTLFTTQKKVTQEGKNGSREVVAKITYINGMEADKEILSQTVLSEATSQIVLKGTKKVPSSTTTNTAGAFMMPVKDYRLTSKFGMRTLEGVTRMHYGVDLAAPTGTPIYASRAGTVNFAGSSSGYGLLVKISHDNGVETRYGHCSKLLVKKGQEVKKGQLIALVGSTGHSTGPHCHFEVRINGTPVNPLE